MSRRLWREQLALIGGPSETGLDLRWLRCMGGHEFAHLRTHRFLVQGGDVLLPKPANERTSLHVWFIGRTRTRLRSADVRASAATPAWPSGIYSMIPSSYTRSSPGSLPAAMRSAQSPESLDLAGGAQKRMRSSAARSVGSPCAGSTSSTGRSSSGRRRFTTSSRVTCLR